MLADLAGTTGHGGGDFWVLYFFAREILTGQPAPFDIYGACDCTIPGILAFKSTQANGAPQAVPDFRDKRQRAKYRHDDFAQTRYDIAKGCFPKGADKEATARFTALMKDLIACALKTRAFLDWSKVSGDVQEKAKVADLATDVIDNIRSIRATMRAARRLANRFPGSDGAAVAAQMLEVGREEEVMRAGFLDSVKKRRARMQRAVRVG